MSNLSQTISPPQAEPRSNPLREGLLIERTPAPAIMVIFGASGDLTRRKLIPALYNLALERLLPIGFTVVGFARHDETDESFRSKMRDAVNEFSRRTPVDDAVWDSFSQGVFYVKGDFTNSDDYNGLSDRLTTLDGQRGTLGNRMYYLATPPDFYDDIIEQIGQHDLNHGSDNSWQRIIVEKPFGHDLDSADHLNKVVNNVFDERDVFRIDHYLGKETVQNIIAFRFANGVWEPIWNRQYVDHVQITVAEAIGIETRGGYYEETGALRDMMQNHLMQLLTMVAMEPPVALTADPVRDEKVKVLHAVRPIDPRHVEEFTVRGQYTAGYSDGEAVPGYREEEKVDPHSLTETFVALKLFIDNWRWAGVPFYLRTGKRMPRRVSEIAIQFKRAPHLLFNADVADELDPNVLALGIQPNEGIALTFGVKVPGPMMNLRSVHMGFEYGTAFNVQSPDAYERLLLDAMLGDSTLFTRRDEVAAAWNIMTQIRAGWERQTVDEIPTYEAGTWGPEDADRLLKKDGRTWREP